MSAPVPMVAAPPPTTKTKAILDAVRNGRSVGLGAPVAGFACCMSGTWWSFRDKREPSKGIVTEMGCPFAGESIREYAGYDRLITKIVRVTVEELG